MEEPSPEEKTEGQVVGIALICYLGPLCLIPLFSKEKSDFLKFHLKQGLLLFILEVVVWLLFRFILGLPGMTVLYTVVSLAFLALSLMGILNVISGEKKELPVIGKYAEGLKFV